MSKNCRQLYLVYPPIYLRFRDRDMGLSLVGVDVREDKAYLVLDVRWVTKELEYVHETLYLDVTKELENLVKKVEGDV